MAHFFKQLFDSSQKPEEEERLLDDNEDDDSHSFTKRPKRFNIHQGSISDVRSDFLSLDEDDCDDGYSHRSITISPNDSTFQKQPSSSASLLDISPIENNSSSSKPPHEDDEQKKEGFRWQFWISMLIVLGTLFAAESSRGIVVPSLYLYIHDLHGTDHFLGYTVAAFSVGRLFGASFFGHMFNRRGVKESLLLSIVVSLIGNIGYAVSPLLGGKWMVLSSRVVVGFGTGTLSVARAHIAATTTTQERTRFIAYSSVTQFLGFAIMPALGAALAKLDLHVGMFPINKFTAPGYFLALLNILILGLVIAVLPNDYDNHTSDNNKKKPHTATRRRSSSVIRDTPRLVLMGVFLFIFLNFIVRGVIALIETVASPLFLSVWPTQHPVEDTATMLTLLGVGGLLIYFTIDYILKCVPSYVVLSIGLFFSGAGALLLLQFTSSPLTLPQFLTGAGLIWSIGSPITQVLIISTFSLMLGSQPQGEWMGYLASAGSVGRIAFPLLGGRETRAVSFILSAIMLFISAFLVIAYKKYVDKRSTKEEQESLRNV